MGRKNRIALKEWAVVVKALRQGRQIFLLRKGGIAEQCGEFRVDQRPSSSSTRPSCTGSASPSGPSFTPTSPPRSELPLDTYAVVE